MKRALIIFHLTVLFVATVSPQAPTQKKPGKKVQIATQSTLPQLQISLMPDVSNGKFTCESAKKKLIEEVRNERVECLPSEASAFPAGTVFKQDPLAQTRLRPRTKITLHISNGQATAPPPDTDADVSVIETHEKKPNYFAGDEVHYKIVVSNVGPLAATNVRITNTQLNLHDPTFQTTSVECNGGLCAIKRLDPGGSAEINVTATIIAEGQFTNVVTVKADQPDPKDNNTSNDSAEAKSSADVSITSKLGSNGPFQAGQTINYILTIHNDGPSNATNIHVSPKRSTNLKFASGACKTQPCLIPNLAAHADATITLSAQILLDGAFETEVVVSAEQHDGNLDNNLVDTKDSASPTQSPTLAPPPIDGPIPEPFPPIWVWPLVGGALVGGGTYGVRRWRHRSRLNRSPPQPPPQQLPPTQPPSQPPPTPAVDPNVVLRPGESEIDRLPMTAPPIGLQTDLRMGGTTFDAPIPIVGKEVRNE